SSSRDGCPLHFSPDGKLLASGMHDDSIYLWDLATGKELCRIKQFDEDDYLRSSFSPDGKVLCTWESNAGIRFWQVPTGKPLHEVKVRGYEGTFSPDSKFFAVSEWNGFRVIGVATGKDVLRVPLGFSALSFSPDGSTLAAVERYNYRIWVWQVPS